MKVAISKKKALVLGGSVLAVVALGAGYVMVVPGMVANNYKEEARAAQAKIAPAMDKVYESFTKPVFSNPEVATTQAEAEVKAAIDAIKDAEAVVNSNEKAATNLGSLPLANMNGSYKSAVKVRDAEKKYISDARAFLENYKQVANFVDIDLDFTTKAEKAGAALETAAAAESEEAFISGVEKARDELKKLGGEYKQLKAPTALKAYFDQSVQDIDKVGNILDQLVQAVKQGDMEKADKASTELDTFITQSDQRTKEFITKLQRDSDIQKSIDQLKNAQRNLN